MNNDTTNAYGDSPIGPPSRISKSAFVGLITTFLVLALLVSLLRTIWRFKQYKKLSSSDYLLIVSCVVLTVAQGFTIYNTPLIMDVHGVYVKEVPTNEHGIKKWDISSLGQILTWVALFGIKLGFLAFFFQIIQGVPKFKRHWWGIFAFTVISAVATILVSFMLAQHVPYLIVVSILDILTDILIVSMPVRLLWGLQRRLSQKLTAGGILSLSTAMILIAIARSAGARGSQAPKGTIDEVWVIFWSALEADVAALMLGMTCMGSIWKRKSQGNSAGSYPGAPSRRPSQRRRLGDVEDGRTVTVVGTGQVMRLADMGSVAGARALDKGRAAVGVREDGSGDLESGRREGSESQDSDVSMDLKDSVRVAAVPEAAAKSERSARKEKLITRAVVRLG